MKTTLWSQGMGCLSLALMAGFLSGCVTHVQSPEPVVVYSPPPPIVQPAPEYIPPPTQPPVDYAPQAVAPVPVYVPAPAPEVVVEIHTESDFYQPLQAYGRWIDVPGYGRCWTPAAVDPDWHPYTDGHWQRTDSGWYWVSDEPWGWATCHYGRWRRDDRIGWVWIPQTQWAPAWVAWREGGGYTGWAPLPPEARIGPDGTFENHEEKIDPRSFAFVEQRRMLEPHHHQNVIVNNTTIINNTVNITKIVVVNQTFVNEGPRPDTVAQATGRKIDVVPAHTLRVRQEAPALAAHQPHPPGPEKNTPSGIAPAHNNRLDAPVAHQPVLKSSEPVSANPTFPQPVVGKPYEPAAANQSRPPLNDTSLRRAIPNEPATQPNQMKPESGPIPRQLPQEQFRTGPVRTDTPPERAYEPAKPAVPAGQSKTEPGQPLRQTIPGQINTEPQPRTSPHVVPAHEPARPAPALSDQQKRELELKQKVEAKQRQPEERPHSQSPTNAPVPVH